MLTEAEGAQLTQEVPFFSQVKAENRDLDMKEWGKTADEWAVTMRKTRKEYADLKTEHEKLKTLPRGVMPLKGDEPPEKVAEFRKTFGVPEKPEGYTFKFPDGIPDGIVNPEDTKSFAALAHSLHVPLATAQKVIDFETQRAIQTRNAFAEKQNELAKKTAAALVEKYKDGADAKVKDALKAIEAFFGPEIRAKFEDKKDPMGNDLAWIEGAIKLSQYVTERGPLGGDAGGSASKTTVNAEDIYSKSVKDGHMQAGPIR